MNLDATILQTESSATILQKESSATITSHVLRDSSLQTFRAGEQPYSSVTHTMAKSGRSLDEPEGIPRQGSVFSQQDLWDNASVEIGTVMSWLGYGPEIIQARRDAYREYGRLWTARECRAGAFIIKGSKAEGLTRFLEVIET
ncbi:hypothetical protein DPMN_039088 [Dreissena polymorpha]|uniref:Uncharacterized protein n=1 Tax=Dreissena polymorpha TaxID=45954 RepID=A0A9D4MGK0_DREPO|nr:hypothetical protein DPMN_039088 [Dreissena polymorpha]